MEVIFVKKIWISYVSFMAFRHSGIEKRYRKVHDRGGIISKIAAQLYLIRKRKVFLR